MLVAGALNKTPPAPETSPHVVQRCARSIALGARLLVGTDSGNPFVVPGFAVIDEIAFFVESGVEPWAALRAATSAAAEYLDQSQEMGAILPGHRADLLLLAGNPLDDITNLRRREGVMLRGVWYPGQISTSG